MKFPHRHKQTVFFEKSVGSRRQGKLMIIGDGAKLRSHKTGILDFLKKKKKTENKTIDK